mgnify:CR=1 FL=1|jgi:hypothetical protein
MRNLERLITRVKSMMVHGLETENITYELLAQGWHRDLIDWAVKAAKFELDYQRSIENA